MHLHATDDGIFIKLSIYSGALAEPHNRIGKQRKPMIDFLMACYIACGRVRMTMMTHSATMESCKMVAILQQIG